MAVKPIEAHQWDFPWGFCPCGWMINCIATDVDAYVVNDRPINLNRKDSRYAGEVTCQNCNSTRSVRVFGEYRDWERIHMAAKVAKKRNKKST